MQGGTKILKSESQDFLWKRASQQDFEFLDSPPAVIFSKENRDINRVNETAIVRLSESILRVSPNTRLIQRFHAITTDSQSNPVLVVLIKIEDANKNRYSNVIPTSRDLISLRNNSYINASKFHDVIITQGPLFRCDVVDTVGDFWRMAFEQNIKHIVCLTDAFHINRRKQKIEKCYPYWEPGIGTDIVYKNQKENLEVKLVEKPKTVVEKNSTGECVIQRIFIIKCCNHEKTVTHWHFEKWKDHSLCDPSQLAQLIHLLILQNAESLIGHCSAGIGRAGVFGISYDFIKKYVETGQESSESEIDEAVKDLRTRRPESVQGEGQLGLISQVIKAYIRMFPNS
jgi:protein tyrosine phosphatase